MRVKWCRLRYLNHVYKIHVIQEHHHYTGVAHHKPSDQKVGTEVDSIPITENNLNRNRYISGCYSEQPMLGAEALTLGS